MKIGTSHMATWPGDRSQRQVLLDFVDAVKQAERLGYYSSWTTEHHMANNPAYKPYGNDAFDYRAYDLASDPLTLLSFAAAQTSRIRLGSGVVCAQYDHPIRIAERAALLDTLSGGRLEMGIGRGGSQGPREPIIFNVPEDQTLNQRRFREVLEIVLAAWPGTPFSFESDLFHIPEGAIVPSLLQDPRKVMIVGSMTPETIDWAAQHGLAYCSSGLAWGYAGLPAVDAVDQRHRTGLAAAGYDPSTIHSPHTLTMYCGVDDHEAAETAEKYLIKFSEAISAHGEKESGRISGPFLAPDASAKQDALRALAKEQIELQIVGSPDTCIQKLQAFRDKVQLDLQYILLLVDFGGIPHETSLASMERFARHVMPHFVEERDTIAVGR